MKAGNILLTLLLLSVLIAPAMAANITGCEVTGSNVYAGSTAYNIGPAAEIDSTSTATGITNTAGRYIYASGLSYTQAAGIVTYTIQNQQGAAVTAAEQGTEIGMYWDYGDGNTARTDSLTHRYNTPSTYNTELTLSNELTADTVTVSTAVTLATSGASGNTVTNTNVYAGSRQYDITPSAYDKGENEASGITHVQNRYLYLSELTATLNGNAASFTFEGRQGAAVTTAEHGTTGTLNWDFGDGTTAQTTAETSHTYSTGIYSAGVTLPGYLSGNITAYTKPIVVGIPTYSAESVTTQDFDIVIETGNLYQPLIQYVLPSATADIEFFAGNNFVLASGRTVYSVDVGTNTAEPVSTTTGNTADKIYLGEAAAIITDIDGNTAVYEYEENTFNYLSSASSDLIATTANYAGIVADGKLIIYDLATDRKIGDIPANVSGFAGNDYGDTFLGFSGPTLKYWWVNNTGAIQAGEQNLTQTITGLKQISQTENYIVTTETNTLIIGVSAVGEYTLVSTSETEIPLTTPQATTIGVTIGVHYPNEIYIIGADGATAGTYQTGSALADSSISKATGLYAITGGADQQTYFLRKDQESTWSLAQIVKANAGITHTQISTTGNYAAFISGVNLYLLKISTNTDTSYYLNGIVIDSNGLPYNGDITINGEKVQTDKNGEFTYPITPGVQYQINAKGTIAEYTATNAALQQIAIRINVNPLATEVDYSAEYSSEAEAILMSYTDSAGRTTAVNWEVRETETNTVVATYSGNTASFPVGIEDSYTNYYVKLNADRGQTSVTKSWSITPAGGYPVDLYGLDDNGKNIIFGFLLLIIAGLFGVLHSRSGAVLVAFAACIMRYLELITIPWIVILIAAVIAIIAAIAGGNR